jgi:hypothetical protein
MTLIELFSKMRQIMHEVDGIDMDTEVMIESFHGVYQPCEIGKVEEFEIDGSDAAPWVKRRLDGKKVIKISSD